MYHWVVQREQNKHQTLSTPLQLSMQKKHLVVAMSPHYLSNGEGGAYKDKAQPPPGGFDHFMFRIAISWGGAQSREAVVSRFGSTPMCGGLSSLY